MKRLPALFALLLAASPALGALFRAGVVYPQRVYRPDALVIADFNGDGRNDVAAAEGEYCTSCRVLVFLQTAEGTLAEPLVFPGPGNARAIRAGHFNDDGRLDLVVAAGRLFVLLQQPDGSFAAGKLVDEQRGAADFDTADLNGDGRTDIVGMPWGSETMNVYEQQAGGTFVHREQAMTGYGYDDFELADLNGDGRADAVNVSGQGVVGRLHVALAKPGGGFGEVMVVDLPWRDGFSGVESGDFNGDSRVDLAVLPNARSDEPFVGLVLQQPDGSFAAGPTLPAEEMPASLLARDFDGDGDADLAATGATARVGPTYRDDEYVVQVWLQTAPGVFASQQYALPDAQSNHSRYEHLAIGDVTGDGIRDLVVAMDRGALIVLAGREEPARRRSVRR
ncbi:MAG TPA: VCBS repeat-containing protein [Thermoanaerobaculia bacterium]|nr:VCBS repeat-containing protein [Thermoanaerobaculia bacterium]